MSADLNERRFLHILTEYGELEPKVIPAPIDSAEHGRGGSCRQVSEHEFEDQDIKLEPSTVYPVASVGSIFNREFLSLRVVWNRVFAAIKSVTFLHNGWAIIRVAYSKERPMRVAFGEKIPEMRVSERVPVKLLEELSRCHLRYSDIAHIFHVIYVDMDHWIGVAGDGANGCYEYFSLKRGAFEISNDGYGDTAVALREALVRYVS